MRSSTSLLGRTLLWIALQARHLNENLEKNLQLESVYYKKTGGKFGGYRLYSYICKCNNNKKLIHIRLNLDEAVCEYRLIFLYVGDPEIFVIHGIHIGHQKRHD